MVYKLILDEGDRIIVKDLGDIPVTLLATDTHSITEALYRYGVLAKCGDPENVHKSYVLDLFKKVPGLIYVMTREDADILSKTGRNMDDVRVYRYEGDAAVLLSV